MISLLGLLLGCLSLGAVLSYGLWNFVRIAMLQAEMQSILLNLDIRMRSICKSDDRNYLVLRDWISFFINNAQYLSLPLLRLTLERSNPTPTDPEIVADTAESLLASLESWRKLFEDQGSPIEVREAQNLLITAIAFHLFVTPVNFFKFIPRLIFGRTERIVIDIAELRSKIVDLQRLASAVKR